jgi:hypothetical protein
LLNQIGTDVICFRVSSLDPSARAGVANAGPAGHFLPARAFEMAHGDFLTSSDRKFAHKLAVKELKTWPAKVPLNQLLALWTSFIMNLARLPKRLATPVLEPRKTLCFDLVDRYQITGNKLCYFCQQKLILSLHSFCLYIRFFFVLS